MSKYTIEEFMLRRTETIQVKISPNLKVRFVEAVGDRGISNVIRALIQRFIDESGKGRSVEKKLKNKRLANGN